MWADDVERNFDWNTIQTEITTSCCRLIYSLVPLLYDVNNVSILELETLVLSMTRPEPYGLKVCASITYRALSISNCFRCDAMIDYLIASDATLCKQHAVRDIL